MTKVNKYKNVEDAIMTAIYRGISDIIHYHFVWAEMAEITGRQDNPYVWNAIKTRLQSMKERGLITHDRATGWKLAPPKPESVVLTDEDIEACVLAFLDATRRQALEEPKTAAMGIAAFRAVLKQRKA
jgi:outer membrane receptor for monomeric catechols